MTDLFSYYPASPGHRGVDTSIAAAASMERSAPRLRERCMVYLAKAPATADEVAAAMDLSVLSVRPRFTELFRTGRIIDTGIRRPNSSGRMAKVWRAAGMA